MSSEADPEPGPARLAPARPVVRLRSVVKAYGTGHQGSRWRLAVPFLPERLRAPHLALDGFDLDVAAGEAVGLIGPNGAGKSTALKVVAGVSRATSGTVEVDGTVRSMIELGVGFHPDLTGWENVWTSLVMAGHPRAEVEGSLDAIAAFAGIADAMDTPVKNYSLGMRARLAFAVATHAPADVLVVDEVLAVGDRAFQERCIDRIFELRRQGSALLFVSHEMALVSAVCDRVLHLRTGRTVDEGPAAEVVERYLTRSPSRYAVTSEPAARIVACRVTPELAPFGSLEVDLEVRVDRPLREPKVGIDLSLPTVAPDLVSASSLEDRPDLGRPGVHRLRGVSRPIGFENADLRATVTIVDGVVVQDLVTAPIDLGGPSHSPRPEVAVRLAFEIGADGGPVAPAAGRRDRTRVDPDAVLAVAGAVKTYVPGRRRTHLAQAAPGRLGRPPTGAVVALDDVDLVVGRGEAVGLIGANGSGKSTLLKAIAGLIRLDRGRVERHGSVVTLLDPGAGFHPELTGRENARSAARLMGIDGAHLAGLEPWIEDFAGLGDAITDPVRQYSSGMRARLGLAVALAAPTDLLLLDEVLAVGDEEFRRKALAEVARRVASGTTVLFVSHELRLVEQLCSRVVRLEAGRLVDDGPATEVIERYGGTGWSGGVHDATGGIRLLPLAVGQRHLPMGGTFDVRGSVVVEVPSPTSRLEVSYRATPEERPETLTREDRELMSILLRTLEPAGGALTRVGTHDFTLRLEGNELAGTFDLVVSVVDELDDTISAETWQEVRVGEPRPEGFPGPVLHLTWSAEGPVSG